MFLHGILYCGHAQEYLILTQQSVGFLKTSCPCNFFHVRLLAVQLFFPHGDAFDLDQLCLSTSAGHKGLWGKLFILTSFRENKPHALGAPVPPEESEKRNPRGCPGGQQLSLCRHDLRPGPVTGMVGLEQGSRRVQVLCVMSELHVQPHGTIKITPHSGGYSCSISFHWQKETWNNAE